MPLKNKIWLSNTSSNLKIEHESKIHFSYNFFDRMIICSPMAGPSEMKYLLPIFFPQQDASSMIAFSSRWVYANDVPLNSFAGEGWDSGRRGMVGEKSGWGRREGLGVCFFFS